MRFCLKKGKDRSSYSVDISIDNRRRILRIDLGPRRFGIAPVESQASWLGSDSSEFDLYPIPIHAPLFSTELTRWIGTKTWRKRHDNCTMHSIVHSAMDMP